ncbi:MAG: hypothetical protein K2W82_17080 [Candidatus Obscuribacterales bacterium]|nr:hypothetical protein [Candidatus Obscuribacterales bacterium]
MARKKGSQLHSPGKTGQEKKAAAGKIRIAFTVEDVVKGNRRDRREEAIENGTLRAGGTGVHGGGKRANNRRDRKESRQALRRGYDD